MIICSNLWCFLVRRRKVKGSALLSVLLMVSLMSLLAMNTLQQAMLQHKQALSFCRLAQASQ